MQRSHSAGMPPASHEDGYWISLAQPHDIASLQEAAAVSWRATYETIFEPEFIERFLAHAYSAASLERAFQDARTHFLVAKLSAARNAEVMAFCQVGPPSHPEDVPPACGELYRLYVRPVYQRRGIGRQLLGIAEDWLAAQGYLRYGCYVHAHNERGKAFYWQMGFDRRPLRNMEDEWYLVKELVTHA
jgi:ribosomal protein S18 acetylase RimI-like enzyme